MPARCGVRHRVFVALAALPQKVRLEQPLPLSRRYSTRFWVPITESSASFSAALLPGWAE